MDLSCPYCHKPYIEEVYEVCGHKGAFPVPQCTCEEEALRKAEEEEKERVGHNKEWSCY